MSPLFEGWFIGFTIFVIGTMFAIDATLTKIVDNQKEELQITSEMRDSINCQTFHSEECD